MRKNIRKSSPDDLFQFAVNKAAFSKIQFCKRMSKWKVKVPKRGRAVGEPINCFLHMVLTYFYIFQHFLNMVQNQISENIKRRNKNNFLKQLRLFFVYAWEKVSTILTKNRLMSNFDWFLLTTGISRYLQRNCTKSKMICNLRFSVTYFVKQVHPYKLRIQNEFEVPFARNMYLLSESISYLGPKIWDVLGFNKGSKLVKQF